MNQLRFAAVFALVLGVSGCATSNFEDLKNNPKKVERFEVAVPYQQAYGTIVREARRCFEMTGAGGAIRVTGEVFSDTKKAEVTLGRQTGIGNVADLAIDLRALGDSRTEIIAAYQRDSTAGIVRAMRAWLESNAKNCTLPA